MMDALIRSLSNTARQAEYNAQYLRTHRGPIDLVQIVRAEQRARDFADARDRVADATDELTIEYSSAGDRYRTRYLTDDRNQRIRIEERLAGDQWLPVGVADVDNVVIR